MMKGHYLLGECLFAAPDAGALYRARDSTQLQAEVLLQVFPARLLDYPAFRAVQAELGRPVPVGIRYLPVLDSCWEAQEALFVLQAPASWGGKVLPDLQQGPPTSLHAQAAVTSRTLQQQGIIRQPLAEHWFLVAPDGELYLLGTALSTRLLACQPLPVSPVGRQRPAWRSWMTYFAILTSASAVFAAGAGLYPFWRASRPLPDRGPGWALPVDTPQPGSLIQQDRPLPVSAPDKALTTAVVKRLPEAVPKPAELAEAAGMVLPVPAFAPRPAAEAGPEADAPAVSRLLERARSAMAQERFQSALYHIRELKQRDAGHPEGVRLGEQLVATLQQQARVHLEHAERAQARLKLRLARQAIIEFRLDSLLAQQQRLEQE